MPHTHATARHQTGEPPILYFGTPVVLISTLNTDGSANLAPMSSAFWLGWRCMLGLAGDSKTTENLKRTRECVLNLPSDAQADIVDRLALTTGTDPAPARKVLRGYRYEPHKFARASLTPAASETVGPPRALECPVHMEARIVRVIELGEDNPQLQGATVAFEASIQRVHLHPAIVMDGDRNRVDPDRWRPLIMSFQKLYGLRAGEVGHSTLAQVPEALYRSPDVERARSLPLRAREHAT